MVKERCIATQHDIPFQRMPKLLTTHIFLKTEKIINLFPMKGVKSDSLSPKTIMSGETLDLKKHPRIQLGQYCKVHEEEIPHNS